MNLKDYLEVKGETERSFGDRVGRTQSAVSKWCNKSRIPDREAMRAIFFATDGAVGPADFYDLAAEDMAKAA
jgi:hypothetical protein